MKKKDSNFRMKTESPSKAWLLKGKYLTNNFNYKHRTIKSMLLIIVFAAEAKENVRMTAGIYS